MIALGGASVATTLIVAPILGIAYLLVWRLFLHPLRSYPGPFLHSISGLPVLYHAWKGDLQYHLYRLHVKYGQWVRQSPNKISVNHVAAFNDVYGNHKNISKPEDVYTGFRITEFAINTFNTHLKDVHRRKRKMMAKGFSDAALDSYEPTMAKHLDKLIRKLLTKQPDSEKPEWFTANVAHEAHCLTLDIMGDLIFGAALGFLDGKRDAELAQIDSREIRIYMDFQEPLLRRSKLDRILFPMWQANNDIADYVGKQTSVRIEKHNTGGAEQYDDNKGRSDMLTHFLNATDPESDTAYTDEELLGESILLMMAGSETTTVGLTTIIFFISRHPAVAQKLHSELTRTFPSIHDLTPRAAENCQYLRACVDEAMRVCPPTPTCLPRLVGPGGAWVADRLIPEGTVIGVPNFATFRNPEYFDEPSIYKPERWIVGAGGTEESVQRARAAFWPFSLGPRMCIGGPLAMKEMSFVVAKLLMVFEFGKADSMTGLKTGEDEAEGITINQRDVFTSQVTDIMVDFKKREGASIDF